MIIFSYLVNKIHLYNKYIGVFYEKNNFVFNYINS